MVRHMMYDVVQCLNQFPWKNGVSQSLSPSAIITGSRPVDFNKLQLKFGTYVQVFENNAPTNTPKARSLGAIALNPTGNAQGDYYFMSLATGARISRHQWTALPMTDTAIARVEVIALHERQPLIQASGLVIEWRPDMPIDDDAYDFDYQPPDDPPDDEPMMFDAIDDDELDDLLHHGLPAEPGAIPPPVQGAVQQPDQHVHEAHEAPDAFPPAPDAPHDYYEAPDAFPPAPDAPHEIPFEDEAALDAFDQGAPDLFHQGAPDAFDEGALDAFDQGAHDAFHQGAPDAVPEAPDALDQGAPDDFDDGDGTGVFDREYEITNAPTERVYNLRPRANTSNHALFNAAMDDPFDGKSYHPPRQLLQTTRERLRFVFGHILTQMSANAGIRKHGKAAEAALMAEFAQLEDLSVYQAVDPKLLTRQQRRAALRAINLIKEKRDGKLKGRTVADGRSQRKLYEKSQTASPTVASDALLLTILIDAYEERDVATADVAGAYLKALLDDYVLMKFTGASVDILCKMNPEHKQFIAVENGVKVLYVRLIKAIYECVKPALLWYNLFSTKLKQMGFVLNQYDPGIGA